MTEKAPVFDRIRKNYLHQVACLEEKQEIAASLGINFTGNTFKIAFFNSTYTISPDEISNAAGETASHAIAVILCKYLLLCPVRPAHDTSLVTYKDFKDAAPYEGGFLNTALDPIARHFANRLVELEGKCRKLGGHPVVTEVSCQLAFTFQALPKVPLILLFNDADEDFPAQATLLFQKNAASYLDMECLAMVGAALAYRLKGK